MYKKQIMQLIKDGMESIGDTQCTVDYNEKSKLFDIYLDLDGLEYKEEEPNFSFTEDGTLITGGDEEWLDWVMLKKLSALSSLINNHYINKN